MSKNTTKTGEGFVASMMKLEVERPGFTAAAQVAALVRIAEALERLTSLAERAAAEEGGAA